MGKGGNNCGPYEEPDADGNCKSTNAIQKLKGQTAEMASINFGFINICPVIVCNPSEALAEAEIAEIEEIDTTSEAPGPLVTETLTPEPSSVGSIPELSLCYWGPGADWGTVSSLEAGIEVEIVGVGAEEGWLIVDNPNFEGVTCWVAEKDVELPAGFDLSSLPEFEIPALVNGDAGDEGGGALAGPSNLKATTAFGNPCKVTLNWKDNSDNESGFRIYRDGILIGTVGANVTTFTDNNATETDGYNYRVRAYNAEGESGAVATDSDTCFG